jgi:hypothetical protein
MVAIAGTMERRRLGRFDSASFRDRDQDARLASHDEKTTSQTNAFTASP